MSILYSLNGTGSTMDLRVSENPTIMQDDIRWTFAKLKRKTGRLKGVLGQFTPHKRDTFAEFGIMFLNEENLGVSVVAHECLHAALAFHRFCGSGTPALTDDCDEAEEDLAYTLSVIVREVYDVLYEQRHIRRVP